MLIEYLCLLLDLLEFHCFTFLGTFEYKEIFLSQYCLVCLNCDLFSQEIKMQWKMEEIAHTLLLRLL